MATTLAQQRALVEQHRQAQIANRASFLSQFLAAWGILDLRDLDRSTPNWLRIVLRLVATYRKHSAGLSLRHYRELRRLGLPDTPLAMPDVEFRESDLDALVRETRRELRHYADHGPSKPARVTRELAQLHRDGRQRGVVINWDRADRATEVALRVTGPFNIKSRIGRGESPEKAARNALVDASGAASRQVQNGGRGTLLTVVQHDTVAVGWVRVTDGNPCAFCAMLASRGIVRYGRGAEAFSDSDPRFIGPGQVKVHDHCGCTLCPVFSRDAQLPGRAAEFQQLWNDNIRGQYSGKDALRAWRRLYEQQQRDAKRAQAA